MDAIPDPAARSEYVILHASDDPEFDRDALFFADLWSPDVLTLRSLHLRIPYAGADRNRGHGAAGWRWNIETLAAGISHRIVPGTVHLIRMRDANEPADDLLPQLPNDVWPRLGPTPPVHPPQRSS